MDLNTITAVVPASDGSLQGWRAGDAWLAGGTWLFSEPQPELHRLIDLTALAWPALATEAHGLEIAATCTLAQLARWRGEPSWLATSLIEPCCEALLGSFKIWNVATVGGNLCLGLPAGPMIALCSALDGVCTIWDRGGTRAVAAIDFIEGPSQTVLTDGALLRSVTLPVLALRSQTAFRQLSLTPLGRSAAVVIGRRGPDGGEFTVTVTAAVTRPLQLRFASPPTADELAAALADEAPEYYDDVHGDPEWRRHLTFMFAEEVRDELTSR